MTTRTESSGGYRSLFWPIVLIGAGIIWLLFNMGVLNQANIAVVFRLWPLLLIIAGLDLLFGRNSPMLGALIGLGGLILFIALMFVGPSLGWVAYAELTEATYTEEVDSAEDYRFVLNAEVADVNITALDNNNQLMNADLSYFGTLDYRANGTSTRELVIEQNADFSVPFMGGGDQGGEWEIQLNPELPLDIALNLNVGSAVVDLRDMNLVAASFDLDTGSFTLSLPDGSYSVMIDANVGDTTLDLPEDSAIRIEASADVGDLNMPNYLTRVSGNDDNIVGDSGVWESEGFSSAENRIEITFNGDVGSLSVR